MAFQHHVLIKTILKTTYTINCDYLTVKCFTPIDNISKLKSMYL